MFIPMLAATDGKHLLALLIPIIAVAGGLAIPIIAIITDYRRKKHLFELHHHERLAAINKGMEVPPLPEGLLHHDAPLTPGGVLLRGLIWLFVGVGLYFALSDFLSKFSLAGLIPAGVGVAYLIYYAVEGRHLKTPAGKNAETTPARQV